MFCGAGKSDNSPLQKSAIATLMGLALFGLVVFVWRIPVTAILTSSKVAIFLAALIIFFLAVYFLFGSKDRHSKHQDKTNNQRNILAYGLAFLILAGELFLVFELTFCPFEYESFLGTSSIEYYQSCTADSECLPLNCGKCINAEGLARYENIGLFCTEPVWKCFVPKSCACINGSCVNK